MVLGLPLLLPADRIVGRVLLEIVKPCVIVSTSIVGELCSMLAMSFPVKFSFLHQWRVLSLFRV